jgi:NHS family xanthosine MFS transporter
LIDNYFTQNGARDWHSIWLTFAGYALVIAILFAIFFKHQHEADDVTQVGH